MKLSENLREEIMPLRITGKLLCIQQKNTATITQSCERERERERESLILCDDMLKHTIKYKISPNFTDVIGCIKTSSKSYWTFYVNSINGFDQLYLYISHTHTYTCKYLHERWI